MELNDLDPFNNKLKLRIYLLFQITSGQGCTGVYLGVPDMTLIS